MLKLNEYEIMMMLKQLLEQDADGEFSVLTCTETDPQNINLGTYLVITINGVKFKIEITKLK